MYKMPVYTCEKCARLFERKSRYDDHKAKKKDCSTTTALSYPIPTSNVVHMMPAVPDYRKQTLAELIVSCKTAGLRGYSGKKKEEVISLLEHVASPAVPSTVKESAATVVSKDTKSPSFREGGPIRYIDLFSGLGAFHTAFNTRPDAFKCVLACDIDEGARRIYKANYGLDPKCDIRTLDLEAMPDFEVLCAGFPCFGAGTKVLTDGGYKSIESVELTDRLFTHTGTFQRILNLQRKTGTPSLRSIDVKFHPHTIQCTDEHPFFVRYRNKRWNNEMRRYGYVYDPPEWLPASKITGDHFAGIAVNTQSVIPTHTMTLKVNQRLTRE
jgi:hypothetical protein